MSNSKDAVRKVLDAVKTGAAEADLVSTLAARLTRLQRQLDSKQEESIKKAANRPRLPR